MRENRHFVLYRGNITHMLKISKSVLFVPLPQKCTVISTLPSLAGGLS